MKCAYCDMQSMWCKYDFITTSPENAPLFDTIDINKKKGRIKTLPFTKTL